MGDMHISYEAASPLLQKVLITLCIFLSIIVIVAAISYSLGYNFNFIVDKEELEEQKYRVLNLTDEGMYIDGENIIDCSDMTLEECQNEIDNLPSGGSNDSSGQGGDSNDDETTNDDNQNNGGGLLEGSVDIIIPNFTSAITFNGGNHIETTLTLNIRDRHTFPKTLSAWAKVESSGTIAWYGRKDTSNQYFSIGIEDDEGVLKPRMIMRSGNNRKEVAEDVELVNKGIYLITAVWESQTNRRLYLNGQLILQNSESDGPLSEGGQNAVYAVAAGRNNPQTPGDYFNGAIADMLVFDAALTSEDVMFLYQNPNNYTSDRESSQITIADTVLSWELTEEDGTIAVDATNRRNHGTHYINNVPSEIISEFQDIFNGRIAAKSAGRIEDFYINTGNDVDDWTNAFKKAQLAYNTVYLDGFYPLKGRINLQPHTHFRSSDSSGTIQQANHGGVRERLFVYTGPGGHCCGWDTENITFANLTMDMAGFDEFGSPFGVDGVGSSNNLRWENLTFIDSSDSTHIGDLPGENNGDNWVIAFNPSAGTHTDTWIIRNKHLAWEHQMLAGGPKVDALIDGMYINDNYALGGRSIVMGVLGEKHGGQIIKNIVFRNNVMIDPWKHGITVGIDSTGDERFLDIDGVIIENNYIEYNDPTQGNSQTSPGILLRFGDTDDSISKNISVRNNIVVDNTNGQKRIIGISLRDGDYYEEPFVDVIFDSNIGPKFSAGHTNFGNTIFTNNQFNEWQPHPQAYIFDGTKIAELTTPIQITDGLDITIFFQTFDLSESQYLAWGSDGDFIRIDPNGEMKVRIDGSTRTVLGLDKIREFSAHEIRLVQNGLNLDSYLSDAYERTVSFPNGPDLQITSFAGTTAGEFTFVGRMNDIQVSDISGPVVSYSGIGEDWDDEIGNNDVLFQDI